MKGLTKTSFFGIVSQEDPSDSFTEKEIHISLDEFVIAIAILSDAESDLSLLFRTLHYTRTRLIALHADPCRAGKKCALPKGPASYCH